MIEVAALEVQVNNNHTLIEKIETSIVFPRVDEPGKYSSACFVRDQDGKPWLIYCPYSTILLEMTVEELEERFRWGVQSGKQKFVLSQTLYPENEKVVFMIISLETPKPKEISRKEIEDFFGIKVVD